MEHPEIFTPAAYEEILNSLQPVYSLTAGLSNKTIARMIQKVLDRTALCSQEYLPEELREKYHLADINYCSEIHTFSQKQRGTSGCSQETSCL